MHCYFAPLEGLTDSIYRRLHHKYFPGVDRYYMPFFSPTMHRCLTGREARELPPAETEAFTAIPQLMTKQADDALWAVSVCRDRGYTQVNLNLGCPSGTVVSKGKGSGMLGDPDALRTFLDALYAKAVLPVSLKTRLGLNDPEEFPRLLECFNDYPVAELILHPRVRKEFYNSPIHMDSFQFCMAQSKIPVCYNGNLCSPQDIAAIKAQFPDLQAVMLGRGLIGDPGMLTPGGTNAAALEAFYEELLTQYTAVFGGPRNAMFRLKENWRYLICRFENGEKLGKRLRKTTDLQEYRSITAEIFHSLPLRPELTPDW